LASRETWITRISTFCSEQVGLTSGQGLNRVQAWEQPAEARLVDTPSNGRLDAIERARYKLRQVEMALRHLRHVPAEIAADLRRARPISDPDLRLDSFFFSCLGLSKSAYYIVMTDRRSRDAIHS
jgi:hypothetical protein